MGGKFTVPLGNSNLSFSQKQFIVDSNYSFAVCKKDDNVSIIFDLNEIISWHQKNPNKGKQTGAFNVVPENILLSQPIAKYIDQNISCDSTPVEDIWKNHSDLKILRLKKKQQEIKTQNDMDKFQSLYILMISSLKTQEDIDNYKETIMNMFDIVEQNDKEIEKSKKIATKSKNIRNFQNIMRSYYNDILVGNTEQQVLYYLQNFKKASNGNSFDKVLSRILSFDVGFEQENMLFTYDKFTKSFYKSLQCIFIVCMTLIEIVHQNKYRNQYELIHTIELVTSKGNNEMRLLQSNSSTEYMLQGNTLTIYDSDIIDLKFSKNGYVYNEKTSISNDDALNNYLYLLLSFKNFDVKSKLYAVFCIILIVIICGCHFMRMEYFITNNVLIDDKDVDEMIQYLAQTFGNSMVINSGYHSKVVNAKCYNTCPVVLKLYGAEDTENRPSIDDPSYEEWNNSENRFVPLYIPSELSIEDDYFIQIANNEYTITNAIYDDDGTSTEKKLIEVKLMAIGSNDNSCRAKSLNLLPIDITKGQKLRVTLKKKNVTDLQTNYQKSGNELMKINKQLEKYKTDINKLSQKNNSQLTMIKNTDIRSYIYYVIFLLIVLSIIGIFIFDINQSIKLYVMLIILTVVGIMNVINYFLNYDVIEGFNALKQKKKHLKQKNKHLKQKKKQDKIAFVNKSNNDFAYILNEILEKFMANLLSSQSNNLYRTITGTLKNEIRTFSGYEQMYKYKIESDQKSLNVMKHEIIQKTGFINFLSVSVLIVTVILLLYIYVETDKYNNIFIAIVVILLLINLYQYYYTILHPIRTKAINKYWYAISETSEKIMS